MVYIRVKFTCVLIAMCRYVLGFVQSVHFVPAAVAMSGTTILSRSSLLVPHSATTKSLKRQRHLGNSSILGRAVLAIYRLLLIFRSRRLEKRRKSSQARRQVLLVIRAVLEHSRAPGGLPVKRLARNEHCCGRQHGRRESDH